MIPAGTVVPGDADTLDGRPAEEIVAWALAAFDRVALVASFQAESSVLIDMACAVRPGIDVITLDTGRLPEETFDMMEIMRRRYPIRLHVLAPDPAAVATITGDHGVNLFRESRELRNLCCDTRKTAPLGRALSGYDAWITGLRRDQASTRATTPVVSADGAHGGIAKVAPLAGWSRDQVWARIAERGIPYHALYDRGYTSIGCAPCTRATTEGEDSRAGRWWWEGEGVKECGLHWDNGTPGPAARSGTCATTVPSTHATPPPTHHGDHA